MSPRPDPRDLPLPTCDPQRAKTLLRSELIRDRRMCTLHSPGSWDQYAPYVAAFVGTGTHVCLRALAFVFAWPCAFPGHLSLSFSFAHRPLRWWPLWSSGRQKAKGRRQSPHPCTPICPKCHTLYQPACQETRRSGVVAAIRDIWPPPTWPPAWPGVALGIPPASCSRPLPHPRGPSTAAAPQRRSLGIDMVQRAKDNDNARSMRRSDGVSHGPWSHGGDTGSETSCRAEDSGILSGMRADPRRVNSITPSLVGLFGTHGNCDQM